MLKRYNKLNLKENLQGGQKYGKNKKIFNERRLFNGSGSDAVSYTHLAGVIFTAKTASAQSNIGIGYETDAVAACVLGGTSFAGGVATVPGVLMGIFIIGFIYNGMNLIGIDSYYQSMTKGAVIIGAVLLRCV